MSSEGVLPEQGNDTSPSRKRRQNVSEAQSEIIRKNISAITEVQREEDSQRSLSERISDLITDFSGSMLFVWLHALWFGVWILLNVGLVHIPHVSEFDSFPFGLLTMIVSLEAIFLSTFVLISQNRMARLSEQRAELDLHVNLLAEQKSTKALEMLDQIARQLNKSNRFDLPPDPEVDALKISPEPQDVINVLREAMASDAHQDAQKKIEKVGEEITGEMKAVRDDVAKSGDKLHGRLDDVEAKVDDIADDVTEIKEQTGEHEKTRRN